jgi:hypothetical protein
MHAHEKGPTAERRAVELPTRASAHRWPVLALQQRLVGNARVSRLVSLQRDGTPFTPAPASGVSPRPPPVPGSPEHAEQEARRECEKAGSAWGAFEADVASYLALVNQARPTPEERRKEVVKILAASEQLPQVEEPEAPGPAQAYRAGFELRYQSSFYLATAFMVAVNLGFELVKSRNLRLPSMKWGRWAGTVGNSKFFFNAEGVAKFGLDKVKWIRFANGKADFSAVAHMVEGKASFRVPGLTGDRGTDYAQTVRTLARIWGKKSTEVEQFLAGSNLRVHHYKDDLIQLVPGNYHRVGHQGTVADFKAIAASAAGTTAGLYALLSTFQAGEESE